MFNNLHRSMSFNGHRFKFEESTESVKNSNSVLEEIKILLHLSWPLILVGIFRFANPMISIIICGRLSKVEFDAAALANSIINVFGSSVDMGFSTSCDTLLSQAYGSKNRKQMGFILQRAMIVMTIVYLLLCCLHINMEPILIAIQQDFEVSRLTSKYVLLYLPGLFFDFQFLALSRYLQNQNISVPSMLSSLVGSIFSGVTQYIAIYILNYGINSSAIIQGLGCFVMFTTQFLYIIITKVHLKTWNGFNLHEALSDWKPFFKYGIPGIVMLSIEQWAYESMNFIAGYRSITELGGQTIAFQTEMFLVTLSIGIGVSVLIRVGHNLGYGSLHSIKRTIKIAFAFGISITIITSITVFFAREVIARIFASDQEILKIGTKLLIIVSIFQILDVICSISGGVLRACGKQLLGAIIMTVTHFAIGIPLGILFVFFIGMDIIGMWLGLVIGYCIETFTFLLLVLMTNWSKEIAKVGVNNKSDRSVGNATETQFYTEEIFNPRNEIDVDSNYQNESEALLKDQKSQDIRKISKASLIFSRTIQIIIIIVIFALAILLRIFLPPSFYIPCINDMNSNSSYIQTLLSKHYPMCNDSHVFG